MLYPHNSSLKPTLIKTALSFIRTSCLLSTLVDWTNDLIIKQTKKLCMCNNHKKPANFNTCVYTFMVPQSLEESLNCHKIMFVYCQTTTSKGNTKKKSFKCTNPMNTRLRNDGEREKKWKQANERKKCTELLNYHRQCQTIWKERKKIEYKKHTLPIITCRQIWELARPTGAYKTDDDDDDIIEAKDCLVVCLANRPTGRW